jgi:hypothetical protein
MPSVIDSRELRNDLPLDCQNCSKRLRRLALLDEKIYIAHRPVAKGRKHDSG